jgi:Putative MetA-pathway of phenol degradation
MPVRAILTVFFAILCSVYSMAQTCPVGKQSDKLICLLPQVYGVDGIDEAARHGTDAFGQFTTDFLVDRLAPLESSIARQSALLPLASPSSGLTYSWDPATKAFSSSTDSFGPIFGERAETMGKHKIFVGLSYQHFNFDRLDGISMKHLPVTLTQADDATTFKDQGIICSARSNVDFQVDNSTTVSSLGNCGYIRDLIETSNQIDLKVHQVTTYVTFGLTNKIDLSIAVPAENIRMAVISTGTIVYNDEESGKHFYGFDPARQDCKNKPCLTSTFTNAANASGIGDVTLRVKGTAWKGERAAVAGGVDLRLPTGDQQNFLGVGAVGIRPFGVWSYAARVSPHALIGYQANGSSIIGGDLNTGRKDRLPGAITYSGGADVWLAKRVTVGFDLVGQDVPRVQIVSTNPDFPDLGKCITVDENGNDACIFDKNAKLNPHPNLNVYTRSYNSVAGSLGAKIRLGSKLLVIGNALFKVNDVGLRSKTVPLVGLSYTF